MGLGLSFASKKGKSTTSGTMTKDESTNQQQSTNTFGTTTGSSSGTTTGSTQGASTTTQSGTQATTTAKTSDAKSSSSLFSDDILGGLEGAASDLLGNLFGGTTNSAVENMGIFDPNKYVESTVRASAAKEQDTLDTLFAGVADALGSSLGNNSMGTLLQAKLAGDSADRLAGIEAQATATGQGIAAQRAGVDLNAQAQGTGLIATILNALKGGVQTSTQTGSETGSGTGTTTNTGTTNTSESSQQDTTSQQQQTIAQLVEALLTGTTHTVGTEDSTTKTKGTEFGATGNFKIPGLG